MEFASQIIFFKKVNVNSNGNSIKLLYPEYMMFPSILYIPIGENLSYLGDIATPLPPHYIERSGFVLITQHLIKG